MTLCDIIDYMTHIISLDNLTDEDERILVSFHKHWSDSNILSVEEAIPFINPFIILKCSHGHEYKTRLQAALNSNFMCPNCVGANFDKFTSNDLLSQWPDVIKYFDYDNNDCTPDELSFRSNRLINWKCKNGHSWIDSPGNMIRVKACRQCKHYEFMESSSLANYEVAVHMWHDKTPIENVAYGTMKKYEFICDNGHVFETFPNDAIKRGNNACKTCGRSKYLRPGYNDLATKCAGAAKLFAVDLNGCLPSEVRSGYYYWRCALGHVWFQRSYWIDRYTRQGKNQCPYCRNEKLLTGFNDISHHNPEVMCEWDWDANNADGIYPDEIRFNDRKTIIHWICEYGHKWDATAGTRLNRSGRTKRDGCPYCAGKRFNPEYNSVYYRYNEYMDEWDRDKNNENNLNPKLMDFRVNVRVWWKCKNGHSWSTMLFSRVKKRKTDYRGCPRCSHAESKGESELYEFIRKHVDNSIIIRKRDRKTIGKELDIFIPALNIAFEYNGDYWHSDAFLLSHHDTTALIRHNDKMDTCEQHGIKLYYIWEDDWNSRKNDVINAIMNVLNNEQMESDILSQLVGPMNDKFNEYIH